MKQSAFVPSIVLATLLGLLQACTKEAAPDPPDGGSAIDTVTALKDAADFPVGAAISYSPMLQDARYATIVKRDFDGVTFDYHMKHGAIVQNNGTMDFTRTDALLQAVSGMEVFGHTLGWHQNQNATYLKTYSGLTQPATTELIGNGGFESGLTAWTTLNSGNPAGSATITAGSGSGEVRTGSGSLKVVNPTAYPDPWRVQVSSASFTTQPGKQYIITYWVKAAVAGSIRLSTGPDAPQYQADQAIGTAWHQVSWIITASLNSTAVRWDLGQAANTYLIDDVSVRELVQPASGPEVAARLDEALRHFIQEMIGRYKSRVRAWDVVNELFVENGRLRTNENTPTTASDVFVWSQYLGRDYALKAFQYAAAADPTATFYINDYNLESSPLKLDSLIRFVTELKAAGAKIDGIGTQMHISWNTSLSGIETMFQKLAATGLKVRVSELDVRIGSGGTVGGKPTEQALANQATMVRQVVEAYRKNVPKSQQSGITVWGVTDNTSWLYNNGADFPLLYDADFRKKPAYSAFLQGLRSQP